MSNVFVTGEKFVVSGTQLVLWKTTTGDVYVEGIHGQVDGSISYKTAKGGWVNFSVNELFGRVQYLTDWVFDGGTLLIISPCYPDAVAKKATNGFVCVYGSSHKGKIRVRKHGNRFIITPVALPKCIKVYGDSVVVDNYIQQKMSAKKTIQAAKLLGFEMFETGNGYGRMTVIYCR